MDNKQIHITTNQQCLTILEGRALEAKEPVKVKIDGVLDSPLKWLEKRFVKDNNIVHKSASPGNIHHSHVIVDREEMTITLVVDEENHYQTTIKGSLDFHPVFLKFDINKGNYITPFEMSDLIKMNRSFFENHTQAMNLVHTLRNFKAKIDKLVEASDDGRGNKRALIDQAV